MTIRMPIKTVSEANARRCWQANHRRAVKLRADTALIVRTQLRAANKCHAVRFPCTVTLTRIAPRQLDSHDNLRSALKAVVDGIADALGVNDRDPRVAWEYAQRQGKPREYAVQIEIERSQT